MAKVALLIGVSEYGSGLNPLPGAVRAVEAMQKVLQPSGTGGFDEVKLLSNPNPPAMREAIETLFSGRTNNDLVLLFFSGHIVQDDSGKLYFATSITPKSPRAELIRVSAIPASFVHELMSNSPCQRQLVILDCCFSSVSVQETIASNNGTEDIKTQLGGKERAIFMSLSSTQSSCEREGSDYSVYTRYLVEGIGTGAADLDSDGWISVDELHQYTSNRVLIAAPAVKPEFYPAEDIDKFLLLVAPTDDPKLKYRKEAERWVNHGEISDASRYILDKLAESLSLTSEDCTVIETEVLKPYQEYQEKLQRYKREFAKVISNDYPVGTQECEELKGLRQSLGLRNEDVAPIEERMAWKLVNLSQSEDNANEVAQPHTKHKLKSVPSTPSPVLPEDTPIPLVQPTNLTPASEDNAEKLAKSNGRSELKSVPSTPSAKVPEYTPIPTVQPTNPAPAVNLSSDSAGSQTNPAAVSVFPKKILLPIGIGGGLAAVALAIGIFTRTSVAPPQKSADTVLSSPTSSPKPSPPAKNSDNGSSPKAAASPDSKECSVFVNGNLRSEPVSFRDNVVESLREPLLVTGKQTKEGWVEVKLSDNKLAWAYGDIISSKDKEDMNACLSRKGIPVNVIPDILPPESSAF